MKTMQNLFNTYGFDLLQIVKDAEQNGNEELAIVIKNELNRMQAIYDVVAQRHTVAAGDPLWKIGADYMTEVMEQNTIKVAEEVAKDSDEL